MLALFLKIREHGRIRTEAFRFMNGFGEYRWLVNIAINMTDDPDKLYAKQIKFRTMTNDGLKILLVDDDKIMLFLHDTFLKRSGIGCDTVLCYNGQEALEYLDTNQAMETTFLVLLDINMPVMNGWEFLGAIRDRPYLPKVLIVMVSSATEESEKARALAFGQVIDYQQKPLTVETCRRIIGSEKLRGFFDNVILD